MNNIHIGKNIIFIEGQINKVALASEEIEDIIIKTYSGEVSLKSYKNSWALEEDHEAIEDIKNLVAKLNKELRK